MDKYKYTKDYNASAYVFAMFLLLILVIVYGGVAYAKIFTGTISPINFVVFNFITFFTSFGVNIYVWKEYRADLRYGSSYRKDPGNDGIGIVRVIVETIFWFIICFVVAKGYAVIYPLALLINGFLSNDRILKVKNPDKYFDGDDD